MEAAVTVPEEEIDPDEIAPDVEIDPAVNAFVTDKAFEPVMFPVTERAPVSVIDVEDIDPVAKLPEKIEPLTVALAPIVR